MKVMEEVRRISPKFSNLVAVGTAANSKLFPLWIILALLGGMLLLCAVLAAIVAFRGKSRVIVNVFTGKEEEEEEGEERKSTELPTVRASSESIEYRGESKMELIPPDPSKKNYLSLESVKSSNSNSSKEYSSFPNRPDSEKWSWDIDYSGELLWQLCN